VKRESFLPKGIRARKDSHEKGKRGLKIPAPEVSSSGKARKKTIYLKALGARLFQGGYVHSPKCAGGEGVPGVAAFLG